MYYHSSFFFIKLFLSNAQEYKDEIKMATIHLWRDSPGQKHKYLLKLKKNLTLVREKSLCTVLPASTFIFADAVARVSGMTFAQFTQKNILGLLQMKSTLFMMITKKIVKNRA
ncbi:MAG: hypothetical protein IPJ13_10235 [Saprospiraceae bacterium]|nr:hypothetical protein [Saprospiraceae bacterium]